MKNLLVILSWSSKNISCSKPESCKYVWL